MTVVLEKQLSERQAEVLCLLWDGLTSEQIGQRLGLSIQLVQRIRLPVQRRIGAWKRGGRQRSQLFDRSRPFLAIDGVLGALVLAFGPLLLFMPRLFIASREGHHAYGGLATDYVRQFRHRWMRPGLREDLLGTPDIQSLNDISGAYRESVEKMTPLLFGVRDLIVLAAVMLIPTIPLLLTEMPVQELMARLGKLMLGVH